MKTFTMKELDEFRPENLEPARSKRSGDVWMLAIMADARSMDQLVRKNALIALIMHIRWGDYPEDVQEKINEIIQ